MITATISLEFDQFKVVFARIFHHLLVGPCLNFIFTINGAEGDLGLRPICLA